MKKMETTATVIADGKLLFPILTAPTGLKPGTYRVRLEIEETAEPTALDETMTLPKRGSGKAGRFIAK